MAADVVNITIVEPTDEVVDIAITEAVADVVNITVGEVNGIITGNGEKATGTHAGILGGMSITNDYLYVCVQTGLAESASGTKDGTAIWKRTILFQT